MKTIILISLMIFPGLICAQPPEATPPPTGTPAGNPSELPAYKYTLHNEQNVRIARPFGISGNIGSGNILGISIDYFVLPELSVEGGAGLTQYIAVKYHFIGGNENIKWSPFIGAAFCFPTMMGSDFKGLGFLSFPLGVHYIGVKGFSFSIALAVSLYSDDYGNGPVMPWGGIRLGYHF